MNKEQVILKVKEIIENETCLEKINENEYKGEVTVGWDEMDLDFDLVKKYTNEGIERLKDDMTTWLCDSNTYEYECLFNVIKNNIDKDIYNEFSDDIMEYVYDNVYFEFPSEFVWDTQIPVNILITDCDDWDYEFTKNCYYDGELLNGGAKWLIKQQGYDIKDYEREILVGEEFTNKFFESLHQEIIDTTTSLNALTVSLSMTLKEFFELKEAFNNKQFEKLNISKYCDVGLVDFWNGAGGTLSIALSNDLILPISNIYDIDFDENFTYGINSIYGIGMNDYWKDVHFNIA